LNKIKTSSGKLAAHACQQAAWRLICAYRYHAHNTRFEEINTSKGELAAHACLQAAKYHMHMHLKNQLRGSSRMLAGLENCSCAQAFYIQ
jgi:hypothetical protein